MSWVGAPVWEIVDPPLTYIEKAFIKYRSSCVSCIKNICAMKSGATQSIQSGHYLFFTDSEGYVRNLVDSYYSFDRVIQERNLKTMKESETVI